MPANRSFNARRSRHDAGYNAGQTIVREADTGRWRNIRNRFRHRAGRSGSRRFGRHRIPLGAEESGAIPQATVVEDCRFARCRHAIASNKGARYVFRHNYVTSGVIAHAIDAHGAEYHSAVGGEWLDVYENVLEQPNHEAPYYDGWAVRVRGGKGAVHDNLVRGYHVGVELTEETDQPCGPVYVWGNTLEPSGGTMVQARRTRGSPESVEAAPPGYRPHPYPHPLAAGQCNGKPPTPQGAAEVCRSE